MRARDAQFTVLDFETTGSVRGWPEEPWQIGVAEVVGGAVTGRLEESWLRVAPDRPFNRYAPGRWSQLRAELAAAPTLAESWTRWRPWLDPPRVLVAHHAGTERGVLLRAAPMFRAAAWLDTLDLARTALPALGDWSLSAVAAAAGAGAVANRLCPGRTWHDALYDATATAAFLAWLLAQPGWRDLSVEDLARVR